MVIAHFYLAYICMYTPNGLIADWLCMARSVHYPFSMSVPPYRTSKLGRYNNGVVLEPSGALKLRCTTCNLPFISSYQRGDQLASVGTSSKIENKLKV
jgi:hypothetical protein